MSDTSVDTDPILRGGAEPPLQAAGWLGDTASFGDKVPTVIFGPGDPELAHQDEELIRLDELERGRRQFAALASIASR